MATDPVTIRPESPTDHDAIREVVAAAFGSDVEAKLVEDIRASDGYRPESALVALEDDEVVGHVMISDATLRTVGGDRRIAMLSPLAVQPSRQRRGIGAALVSAVTTIADDQGEPFVILEGNPVYYGRFGFEHSLLYGIEIPVPDWAPSEAGQVLRLQSYDPSLQGSVVYPAPFDGLE